MDANDVLTEAVALAPIASVALSLIQKIVQMAADAKDASQQQHDVIMAQLQAADEALDKDASAAHDALASEIAEDSKVK